MKSRFLFYGFLFYGASLLFSSENAIPEDYPQKTLDLTQKQKKLLEESQKESQDRQPPPPQTKNIKGSTILEDAKQAGKGSQDPKTSPNQDMDADHPYAGFKPEEKAQEKKVELAMNKKWIYGTAVITTTFLDGSVKRSYGILLRNGMFITSANMVYDKSTYARLSYAMMQDDSAAPFICVAKLSTKALDLQKGLAILETLDFTDMYCNVREKAFYHERIYSRYWIDVFSAGDDFNDSIVYSPYITDLNAFATERNILSGESLGQLAEKESTDFEGYKHAYGKGFYTADGRLLGIIGASNDNIPKLIRTKEIANFICELRDQKILSSSMLETLCPPPKIN